MKHGMTAGVYNADIEVFQKEIEQLAACGFDCVDYRAFVNDDSPLLALSYHAFEAYLREQKAVMDASGIDVFQTHGPWVWPPRDLEESTRAIRFERMKQSIEATAMLGCRYMVVHNLMPFRAVDTDPVFVKEINFAFFSRLAEVAREYGMVICLENMPYLQQVLARPADMAAFARSFENDHIRMCLDTGHSWVHGISPAEGARAIGGDQLMTLHIHDNDTTKDQHLTPFHGTVDWADFAAALREIGFAGALALETKIPKEYGDAERVAMLRELKQSLVKIEEMMK